MTDRNDIEKELRDMNSSLADCSKIMPYQLPVDYFDDFATQTTYAVKNQATGLPNNAMPFYVPDNYFDSLPQQLIEKTKQPSANKKKNSINIWQSMRWAAAALLIFAVGIGAYQSISTQSINVQSELSELSENAISNYIQDNIDDFDADMLASNIVTFETDLTEVNEEDMESYLDASEWQ